MARAQQGDAGFRTLLKKRNFLLLWLAQLISMTIFNASNYAVLVLIKQVTGSTTLVGVAIICFSVPAVIFGAPAGVFVDHMSKRRVLWASNCLRALAIFIFVISLLVAHSLLLPVYLLTFLISAITQFFAPAEGSTIPILVGEEELMSALSLFNITFMLSQALGYVLLAPIALSFLPTFSLAGFTINAVIQLYFIVGVLYLVCALLVAAIPKSVFVQSTQPANAFPPIATQTLGVLNNVWHEMTQGWRFVRRNKALFLAVVQLSFAGVLILVIGELATPIVTDLLRLPANAMAFVFAPAGIGLVAGSILMPRIAQRLGSSRTIFIGACVLSIAMLLLPLTTLLGRFLQPHGWNTSPFLLGTIALLMLFAGFGLDFINIPSLAAMQEMTPDWIKGRVLALQIVFYNAWSIPVILFLGALSDLFGIDRVLYLLAVLVIAFGFWSAYYDRRHPKPASLDEVTNLPDQPEPDKLRPRTSNPLTQGDSKVYNT